MFVVDIEPMGARDRAVDHAVPTEETQRERAVLEPIVVENGVMQAFPRDEVLQEPIFDEIEADDAHVRRRMPEVGERCALLDDGAYVPQACRNGVSLQSVPHVAPLDACEKRLAADARRQRSTLILA